MHSLLHCNTMHESMVKSISFVYGLNVQSGIRRQGSVVLEIRAGKMRVVGGEKGDRRAGLAVAVSIAVTVSVEDNPPLISWVWADWSRRTLAGAGRLLLRVVSRIVKIWEGEGEEAEKGEEVSVSFSFSFSFSFSSEPEPCSSFPLTKNSSVSCYLR